MTIELIEETLKIKIEEEAPKVLPILESLERDEALAAGIVAVVAPEASPLVAVAAAAVNLAVENLKEVEAEEAKTKTASAAGNH
jgi:hypothetical protein